MADLKKVAMGLERCWQPKDERTVRCQCSSGCPYMAAGDIYGATCRAALNRDALDLVQAQAEEIRQLRRQLDEAMLWR